MNDNFGLSPVVGAILFIAITVLLSSVVGIFVLQYEDSLVEYEPGNVGYSLNTRIAENGCQQSVLEIVTPGNSDSVTMRYASNNIIHSGTVEASDKFTLLPKSEVTIISEKGGKKTVVNNFDTGGEYCGLVTSSNYSSNADSTVSFYYDVKDMGGSGTVGNSLNTITVSYDSGSNIFNSVTENDIIEVGFDRDDDSDIDVSTEDDLSVISVSNNGRQVQLHFIGNYNVKSGDNIILKLDNISNPSSGTYKVTVDINGDVDRTEEIEYN